MKVTEDLLPGPVADASSLLLSQAAVLHLAHNVASVAVPTIGSACAAPEHPLDPHQKSKRWQFYRQMSSRSE